MAETIGQRLKKAREYRNLSLEKAADATHIRSVYLRALEADDFSTMPSPVQARGFLRNYAQYLNLDLDQIVDELRAANQGADSEAEVVFEGEQAPALPEIDEQEEPQSEGSEGDTTQEPFWQTWLRRVQQEAGRVVEEPVSETLSSSSPDIEQESAHETDASQVEDREADDDGSENMPQPKPWASLLERVNIRISREQPGIESEEEVEEQTVTEPEPEADVESSIEPVLSSQEIINNIGLQLRQRRETLSLTLDEIERHTRMRAQFMESLEKGNFDELPSPVQTRGMLSNYASFLDLDVDDLLLQFAEALQARHRERHPRKPARRRGQPSIPSSVPALRSFIAGDMVFGIGMVVLLIAFSIWGISRVIALQSEREAESLVEESGPSISEALIGTPQEEVESEVTLIPAEDTPIPTLSEGTFEIPTLAPNVNVQVNIVALERSYLKVTVDGEVAFDGRTIPGNAYPFDAEQSVEVLAGNGAALRVVYNQRDLGLLGGFGQIARFIYTADEVVIPTPEVPPTATLTPFLSPTPSRTSSPTAAPSRTPTPTATPLPDG